MELDTITQRMAANAAVIAALLQDVTPAQARWKPSPDDWSLLEVACHLLDEEREDFRARVDYTLHRPEEAWPPIDPAGWVTARDYNARDLATTVDAFLAERRASLAWLHGLDAPDWTTAYIHPVARAVTAGDLLAAWVVHDTLHIRQLNELHYRYHAVILAPRRIDYAGQW